jgi:Tfp pilus assembly protein PilX
MTTRPHRPHGANPHRQRGATLIVSLIMLLLITMLAVSSFTLGKSNLQIVGNMQQRGQAFAAAEAAVATVISSTQFSLTPTNAIAAPCMGANTTCASVNGSATNDIVVTVTAVCDSTQPILNTQLNFNNPNDAGCLQGAAQDFGVAGASNNNSMCSNNVWEIQASATDQMSGANYVVDQGVMLRVGGCP